MQASADETPARALHKGHLLVIRPAFPRESCVESFWNWLIGVESLITLICLYSLVLSALHIACLTASAFPVSAPPLGCYLNPADLTNLALSICDIKNAATCILIEHSGNVMQLAESCPELRVMMSQVQFCFLPEIFVCNSTLLDLVSM